jgi:hypothetical protein
MHAIGYLDLGYAQTAAAYFNESYANIQPPFNVWTETPQGGTTNFITGAGITNTLHSKLTSSQEGSYKE